MGGLAILVRRSYFFLFMVPFLSGSSCGESPPSPPEKNTVCLFDEDCPAGQACVSGVCDDAPTKDEKDAGTDPQVAADGGVLIGILLPVEEGPVEFGAQRLGASVQRTVILSNVGTAALDVLNISVNNDEAQEFNVYPSGDMREILEVEDTLSLTVTHTPKDATADFSELQIIHTGHTALTKIELQAEFKGNPEIWVSNSPYDPNSTSLSVLHFGSVLVGSTATQKIYVRNVGSNDSVVVLTGWAINPSTGEFESFPEALLDIVYLSSFIEYCTSHQDCTEDYPVCDQDVCFNEEGAAASTYALDMFFSPNTQGTTLGTFILNGYGNNDENIEYSLSLEGVGLQGYLTANPTVVVFDDAFVGYPQAETLRLKNTGDGELVINQINWVSGEAFSFSNVNTPFTLAADAELTFSINFFGLEGLGLMADTLKIHSNAGEPVLVEVRADVKETPALALYHKTPNAMIPLALHEPFNLGHVLLTQQKETELLVINQGAGELRIDNIFLSSNSSEKYVLSAVTELPVYLPSASMDVDGGVALDVSETDAGLVIEDAYLFSLVYEATTLTDEDDEATLLFENNDPRFENQQGTFGVLARTVDPILSMAPAPVDFGTRLLNEDAEEEKTLVLSNTGQGALTIFGFGWGTEDERLSLVMPATPFQIASGDHQNITLRMRAHVAGALQNQLIIEAPTRESGDFHSVNLMGNVLPGELTLSPSPLVFDVVYSGYSQKRELTITNTGGVGVQIHGLDESEMSSFSVVNVPVFPMALSPDESLVFDIDFHPVSVFSYVENLTVQTNMVADPILELSGESVTAPGLVIYDANGIRLEWEAPFDMGDVRVGEQKEITLRIANEEPLGTLVIEDIALSPDANSEMTLSIVSALPKTIMEYDDTDENTFIDIVLSFSPSDISLNQEGELDFSSDILTVVSSDPITPNLQWPLYARAIAPEPHANALPFGPALVGGAAKTENLAIGNTGHGPFYIQGISWVEDGASNPFSFSLPDSFVAIEGNSIFLLPIEFDPTFESVFNKVLNIEFEDGMPPMTVSVTGTGTLGDISANPIGVNFGNVFYGEDSYIAMVVLSNDGPVALPVHSLYLVGDGQDFSIVNGATWNNIILDAGDSKTLQLRFSPVTSAVAMAQKSASLLIKLNNNDQTTHPRFAFSLSGQTQQIPNALLYDANDNLLSGTASASISLGDVIVGQNTQAAFRLKNLGEGQLVVHASCFLDAQAACTDPNNTKGSFSFSPVSSTVNPGAFELYELTYAPTGTLTEPLSELAILQIHTNDPLKPTMEVTFDARAINPVAQLTWPGDFPDALVLSSDSNTQILEITNTGVGPLGLESLSLPEGSQFSFQVTDNSDLATDETRQVEITFSPTSAGTATSTLVLDFVEGVPYQTLDLVGKGVLGELEANDFIIPFTFVDDSNFFEVTLTNTSTVALPITNLNISGSDSASFTVVGQSLVGTVLAQDETSTINLQFEPISNSVSPTTLQATLNVFFDVASGYPPGAQPHIDFNGTTQLKPEIKLYHEDGSPFPEGADPILVFGELVIGQTAQKGFRLRNTGAGQLDLTQICFMNEACLEPNNQSGSFTYNITNGAPGILNPNEEILFTVTYSPQETLEGQAIETASLSIQSNDPGHANLSITLSGGAIDPQPSLSSLEDFPDTLVYGVSPTTQTLEVSNIGIGPLIIEEVLLAGSDAFSFSLPNTLEMASGESVEIVIDFRPEVLGEASGGLTINFANGVAPASASLLGNGVYGSLSPESTAFLFTFVSHTWDQDIIITNTSSVDLPIAALLISGTNSASFSILGESLSNTTLAADASSTVSLRFTPTSSSPSETTLVANLKVLLDVQNGYPQQEHPIIALSGTTQLLPAAGLVDSNDGVLGSGVNATLDFGDVVVGETVTQVFKLKNTGSGLLSIMEVCFGDGECNNPKNVDGFFSFGSNPEAPESLASNGEVVYTLTFTPTGTLEDVLSETASLIISTNDPNAAALTVAVTGRAIDPEPNLIWPGNFPETLLHTNNSQTQTLNLQNNGPGPLHIATIELTGSSDFTYEMEGENLIEDGASRQINISFLPTSLGTINGSMNIAFEGGVAPESLDLVGTGAYGALSGEDVDFGFVFVGNQAAQDLVLTNTSEFDLPISTLQIVGTHTSSFEVTGQTLEGTTLTAGASSTVSIRFTPDSLSATQTNLAADLKININAGPNYPDVGHPRVSLGGTTQLPPEVELYHLDGTVFGLDDYGIELGDVVVGQTAQASFRLRNIGTGRLDLTSICFFDTACAVPNDETGYFSFVSTPENTTFIDPGEEIVYTVTYLPTGPFSNPVEEAVVLKMATNDAD